MRRRGRRLTTLTAIATLTVLAPLGFSACGDSGLSAGQVRLAASQSCRAAGARAQRIATPSAPGGSRTFLIRGVGLFAAELVELRKLKPPNEMASVYATAVTAFTDKLLAVRAAVGKLDRGADPVTTIRQLQRKLSPIEAREDAAWHALDVPACLNR
jgi:hypothetical protein